MLRGKWTVSTKISKLLCLMLVLVIFVSGGLTGCGGSGTGMSASTSGDSAQTSAAASSGQEKLGPVELTMYVDGTPQKDTQLVTDAINAKLKDKINATLKLIEIDWGAYMDKMKVIVSSGEPYDIAYTSTWATNFPVEMQKGSYMPLNTLLDKYGSNIKSLIPDNVWPAVSVKGQIYAIPSLGGYAVPFGIIVRKDLAEKYKFDINSVKKFSDLEPLLDAVKKNEPGVYPYLQNYGKTDPLYVMSTAGFDISKYVKVTDNLAYDTSTNKVVNMSELPEYTQTLEIFSDWYKKGYIRKDAATIKDTYTELKTGKYAAASYSFCIGDGGAKLSKELNVGVLEKQTFQAVVGTEAFQNNCVAIGATSKNPERAMMFLNLLNDKNDTWMYNTLAAGLENKHYKKTGENTVEYVDKAGYDNHLGWEFGNMLCKWYTKEEGPDFIAKEDEYNKQAKVSPILGFTLNVDNVKNEAAKVASVTGEYGDILFNGMIGGKGKSTMKDMIDEYNNKLKSSGIEKLMGEVQKQIDQWRKDNGK